jgi:plastocyanin
MRLLSLSRRALLAVMLIVLAAIASSTPSLAADVTISITNFAFTPAETTVPVGTKVVFKNEDDTIHSVVADDGSFHSDGLDTNDEYSFTFTKAGIFPYHCGLHPFMMGKITVQ